VYGDFIGERHHSQVATAQLIDARPKPMSILLLRLGANWRFDHANAHFFCKVRPLAQHFVFKIRREFVSRHDTLRSQFATLKETQKMPNWSQIATTSDICPLPSDPMASMTFWLVSIPKRAGVYPPSSGDYGTADADANG